MWISYKSCDNLKQNHHFMIPFLLEERKQERLKTRRVIFITWKSLNYLFLKVLQSVEGLFRKSENLFRLLNFLPFVLLISL